jgi:hypothetical protein
MLTKCERDRPVDELAREAAVTVEDVTGDHALGCALPERREGYNNGTERETSA